MGAILEIEVSQIEQRLQFLPVLQSIVVVFAKVLRIDILVQVHHLANHFGIDSGTRDLRSAQARTQGSDDVCDKYGVLRDDRAAALGHDRWWRYVLRLTDLVDGIDDVIGEFLHAVVHTAV